MLIFIGGAENGKITAILKSYSNHQTLIYSLLHSDTPTLQKKIRRDRFLPSFIEGVGGGSEHEKMLSIAKSY